MAAAFSNIGMWALIYGRLWLMHNLTDSPLMVGLVTTASLGPVLVFSMWGGVVADRVNRLVLVQYSRAMFAILALLTGALIATDVIEPWHLIAISIATGLLLSFDIPSRSAMLPSIVPREHLASAIALYSLVFGGASIVGPALFAPLVALWGIEGVFFLIGAAYALTVGALMLMSTSVHRPKGRPTTLMQGLIDGFRYILRNRVIKSVILLGIIMGTFGASYVSLLPGFADGVITGGVDTYGRLLLSAGIGGMIATATIALLGTRVHPARFFVISGDGFGLGLLILSRVTSLPAAALMMGLIGGCRLIFNTMSTTLIQTLAEDEFRGRVMSIHQFSWGSTALGALLMGAIGEGLGVPFALSLGGLVVAAATVVLALTMFRQILSGVSESSPVSLSSEHSD